MIRILATDGMEKGAIAALEQKGCEVVCEFYEPEALKEAVQSCDVLVVRSATKVRAPHIDAAAAAGRLKLIIRGGVGVDNIDVAYAEQKGIAVRNTPRAMREASLALGASQWQTIYKVIIPYAGSGISAAVVLGIGRAIGETMAVLMVTGNAAVMPRSLFEPVRTIPATIAAELGEAPAGGAHYEALFMLGCILFIITMIISVTAEAISKRQPNRGL